MKIERFEIRIINIPMKMTVEHTLAERTTARNIIVSAYDSDGQIGWGECCPRDYVTGETIESAVTTLRQVILPRLTGRDVATLQEASDLALSELDRLARNQQAAFCAAELAMLDLAGKVFGQSAGEILGAVIHDKINYTGVIAANSEKGVRTYAALLKQFGARIAKVKTGADLETNMKYLGIVREVLGPEAELRIDANSAWDAKTAIAQLGVMEPFGLAGVEQPLPGDDIDGMSEVTAAGIVPVIADESLASVQDAEKLIARKACNIFNIRISKCGGLSNAARLHRMATQAGLRCQLGAQVGETGLLSAAGRHYATRSADVRWFEGSYDSLLLEDCITEPDITVGPGGVAKALTAPGLGVTPSAERLAKYTTDKIELT